MAVPELAIILAVTVVGLLPILAMVLAAVEILKLRRRLASLERRVHELEVPTPPTGR